MTDHTITVTWNAGYRATCSCGRYHSKLYPVRKEQAQNAGATHIRAMLQPAGFMRRWAVST